MPKRHCKLGASLRRSEVEKLTFKGWTAARIATHLNCSRRQVEYDRAYLAEEYKRERLQAEDEHREFEHRRLLHLYNQAMHDYELSKKKKIKCHCWTEEGVNLDCTSCGGKGWVMVECVGDPQFLQIAKGVSFDIRNLWGLNAPKTLITKRLTIDFEQLTKEMDKIETADVIEQQLIQHMPQLSSPAQEIIGNGQLPNGLKEI